MNRGLQRKPRRTSDCTYTNERWPLALSKLFLTIAAAFAEAELRANRAGKGRSESTGRYLGGKRFRSDSVAGDKGELVPHGAEQRPSRKLSPCVAVKDSPRAESN
jgi:hypothetical protein